MRVVRALALFAAGASRVTASRDAFVFLDNGVIRVGVDATRGGSIGWLSLSSSNESLVNKHDEGREIQLSFYAGPR